MSDPIIESWLNGLTDDLNGPLLLRAYWRMNDASFGEDDLVFEGEADLVARRSWGVGRDVPTSLATNRVGQALSGLREIEIGPGEVSCRWPAGEWITVRREPANARPWEDPLWLLDVLPFAVARTVPQEADHVARDEQFLEIDIAAARAAVFVPQPPRPRFRPFGRGNTTEPLAMRAWVSDERAPDKWLRFVWPEETATSAAIWHETRLG